MFLRLPLRCFDDAAIFCHLRARHNGITAFDLMPFELSPLYFSPSPPRDFGNAFVVHDMLSFLIFSFAIYFLAFSTIISPARRLFDLRYAIAALLLSPSSVLRCFR